MRSTAKLFKAVYDKLGRRVLEIYQYGAKTAQEIAPFGDDACPFQGMDAVYMETGTDDEPVVIGYMNLKQLAKPGEKRIFSTSSDGAELKTYLWLKNDGTVEIAGKNNNLVRYTPLNDGLQDTVNKLNTELIKIQTALAAVGGMYQREPLSIDISNSKIDEIKCI